MPSTSTDYRTTVGVNAPAEVVFDRVTSVEALAAWWSPVTGSGLTGGELRFPMVADQPPLLVRVDQATRPSIVGWTVLECTFMQDWVGTQPTFTITTLDEDTCELTFEHRGLTDKLDCKDMCSRSWDHFIGTSLRELAEGGPGAPNRSPLTSPAAPPRRPADPSSTGAASPAAPAIVGQHYLQYS